MMRSPTRRTGTANRDFRTGRRSRWRTVLLVVAGLLLACVVSAVVILTDSSPLVSARPAPTAEQVAAGRDAVNQLWSGRQSGDGASSIKLGSAQLDGLGALATNGFRSDRLDLSARDGSLYVTISRPLPFGRWLNVSAVTGGASTGFPGVRLRIGSLPLSPSLSRLALEVARWGLRMRGTPVPPLDNLVQSISIASDEVSATVNVPEMKSLVGQLANAGGSINAALVVQTYCRLTDLQRLDPKPDFAAQVQRAFPADQVAAETPSGNRAAFIALAMLVVDKRVGDLVMVDPSQTDLCPLPSSPITLHGRRDWPKHWALSAALAAAVGVQLAESAGEWIELADRLSHHSTVRKDDPSGFSFVDLSADRSGFRIARAASADGQAAAAAERLSTATADRILPPSLTRLSDGLSGADFAAAYGGIDDPRYVKAVREIDAVLAGSGL